MRASPASRIAECAQIDASDEKKEQKYLAQFAFYSL
jgi:hypothetical protein